MYNKITLIGRISNDLELRYTNSNKPNCRFNLAVNRNYTNVEGERETDFITCRVWGKQAENLVEYQKKGSLILIEGQLTVSNYEDAEGNRKIAYEVMTNNVQYLEKKKETIEVAEDTSSDPFAEYGETVEISDDFLD